MITISNLKKFMKKCLYVNETKDYIYLASCCTTIKLNKKSLNEEMKGIIKDYNLPAFEDIKTMESFFIPTQKETFYTGVTIRIDDDDYMYFIVDDLPYLVNKKMIFNIRSRVDLGATKQSIIHEDEDISIANTRLYFDVKEMQFLGGYDKEKLNKIIEQGGK